MRKNSFFTNSLTLLAVLLFGTGTACRGFDTVDDKIMAMAADVTGAAGCSYRTRDSNQRQMASLSLLDSFDSQYKYLALYHAPVPVGNEYRYDVYLAGSDDLKKWINVRELIHNADMPRVMRVWDAARTTNVIAVVHEQWTGPLPGSTCPCQIGVKLYRGEQELLRGDAFSETVLPLSSFSTGTIEGTPNFYNPSIELSDDGSVVFKSTILFHYFSRTEGRDQQAYGFLEGLRGSRYKRWTTHAWGSLNRLMDEQGVKGNVGQRSVQFVGNDLRPSMFLEANVGGFTITHGQSEWADWRIFYLRFPSDDIFSAGKLDVKMIEPETHKRSVSFGNPSWQIMRSPDRKNLIIAFNYFLFSEGTKDRSESESLLFYHNLPGKDFDEDGLDDRWEYKYTEGLSFFNNTNKNTDFNHNGLSALEESARDLNPFLLEEK